MALNYKPPQSSGETLFVKRILLIFATSLMLVFGLAVFVPGPIQKSSYMGAEYCGSCHQAEYAQWIASPHARATEVLSKEQQKNPACTSCHANAVFEKGEPPFRGVQCESCHGPGQYYASLHVKKDPVLSKLLFMQKPDLESCRHCHSAPANLWSPHRAMKKIDHWTTGETKAFHGVSINAHVSGG